MLAVITEQVADFMIAALLMSLDFQKCVHSKLNRCIFVTDFQDNWIKLLSRRNASLKFLQGSNLKRTVR